MSKPLSVLAASLLAAPSFGPNASAKDYQVADPSNYSNSVSIWSFNNQVPTCCVADQYHFSFSNLSSVAIDFSYSLRTSMFPETGSVVLYKEDGSTSTLLSWDYFNATKNDASIILGAINPGTYHVDVNVQQVPVIDSAFNYSVGINSTTLPVDEPPVGVMLISGMGLLGALLRKKRANVGP